MQVPIIGWLERLRHVPHLTPRRLDEDGLGAVLCTAHSRRRRDLDSQHAPTCKPRQ